MKENTSRVKFPKWIFTFIYKDEHHTFHTSQAAQNQSLQKPHKNLSCNICSSLHPCKAFRALWSTYSSLTDDRGMGDGSWDIGGIPSALLRESAKSSTSDLIIFSFFFFLSSFSFTFFLRVARSNKALYMIKGKKNNKKKFPTTFHWESNYIFKHIFRNMGSVHQFTISSFHPPSHSRDSLFFPLAHSVLIENL